MDPNETLRQLRELLSVNRYGEKIYPDDADRARDLFEALDQWLARGGFLPDAWRSASDGFLSEVDNGT